MRARVVVEQCLADGSGEECFGPDSEDERGNEVYFDEEPVVLQIPANVALFDSDSDRDGPPVLGC